MFDAHPDSRISRALSQALLTSTESDALSRSIGLACTLGLRLNEGSDYRRAISSIINHPNRASSPIHLICGWTTPETVATHLAKSDDLRQLVTDLDTVMNAGPNDLPKPLWERFSRTGLDLKESLSRLSTTIEQLIAAAHQDATRQTVQVAPGVYALHSVLPPVVERCGDTTSTVPWRTKVGEVISRAQEAAMAYIVAGHEVRDATAELLAEVERRNGEWIAASIRGPRRDSPDGPRFAA